MSRNRKPSRGKKINPHYLVFCEGKTEEAYICFLKSKYRIPIEIIPKVIGNNINNRIIENYKKGKEISSEGTVFI